MSAAARAEDFVALLRERATEILCLRDYAEGLEDALREARADRATQDAGDAARKEIAALRHRNGLRSDRSWRPS